MSFCKIMKYRGKRFIVVFMLDNQESLLFNGVFYLTAYHSGIK